MEDDEGKKSDCTDARMDAIAHPRERAPVYGSKESDLAMLMDRPRSIAVPRAMVLVERDRAQARAG